MQTTGRRMMVGLGALAAGLVACGVGAPVPGGGAAGTTTERQGGTGGATAGAGGAGGHAGANTGGQGASAAGGTVGDGGRGGNGGAGTGGVGAEPRPDASAADSGTGGAAPDAAASDVPPPRPAICDNLPALPVTYKVKRGPKASEDFTFDREGNLVSVDNRSGNIFKSPFAGKPVLFAPTRFAGGTAGTRMLPNGDLVVAEVGGGSLFRVNPAGVKTRLASGFAYPNGIEIHLDGSIFVADQENRRIVKVDPVTGKSTIFVSGPLLGAPNGVTFSQDYRILYIGDFERGRVLAVDVNPDGTGATPRVLVARIGDRQLDGMAVDECGNVYVDEYEAAKVWRVTPDGKLSLAVDISKDSGWIPNMQWGSGIGGWDPNILYVSDREADVVYEVALGVKGKRVAHLP
ncbi:MAG TPA: SMP-30/gluconolactonase/LRE family protein [Polyangia bacterium]